MGDTLAGRGETLGRDHRSRGGHRPQIHHSDGEQDRRRAGAAVAAVQAEAQAVADVRNQAIDIAVAAAAKLLKENVDAGKGDQIIDSAIAELDRKLH